MAYGQHGKHQGLFVAVYMKLFLHFGMLWRGVWGRRCAGALFCWAFALLLPAQRVDRLTVEDGLSQGFVRDVLCDSDGFLWATTLDGLNRYDGTGFRIFRHDPADPFSLPSNQTVSILEDSKNRIWVVTDKGLHLFDRQLYRFYNPPALKGISVLQHLSEDYKGRLWGIARDTLFCLEPPDQPDLTMEELARQSRIVRRLWVPRRQYGELHLLETAASGIYFSSQQGLFHLDYDHLGVNKIEHDLEQPPVNAIWQDAERGELWLKSGAAIGKLKGRSIEKVSFSGSPAMYESRILQHGSLTYFIASDRVYRWNGVSAIELPYRIPEAILSADMDRQGNIWLGTNAHGLRKIMPNRYYFPQVLYGISISSAPFQDQAGNIWINSGEKGSRRFDEASGTLQELLAGDANSCALQARDGRYWVWVRNELVLLDRPGNVQQRFQWPTYQGWGGIGMLEDRWGNILLGMRGPRFVVFNPRTQTFSELDLSRWFPENELPNLAVLCETPDGSLWIGTKEGLLQLTGEPATGTYSVRALYSYAPDEHGLSDRRILSLLPDPADPNVLWIGTQHGLNCMDIAAKRFRRYTLREGLPNDVIYSILPGEQANLWLGTNNGLLDFDKGTGSWRHYTTTDGLPASEFNTMAAIVLRDGRLFFGSVNGATLFEPARTRRTYRVPQMVITELRVNNQVQTPGEGGILEQAMEITRQVVLDYDEDNIGLSLALLDYVNPKANHYQYQLQGVDTGWVNLGNEHKVNFAHLPPGQYVFRARGCNSDGAWSEPVSLDIQVLQPWWRRWWALFLFAAMFAGVIAWIVRAWLSEVRLRDQWRLEHLETERLKELDQFKTHVFANIAHEFRTPISVILGLTERLTTKKRGEEYEQLVMIERNAADLLRLTNQLLDLQKIEAQQFRLNPKLDNLNGFIQRIAEPFVVVAEGKDVRLSLELPSEPFWMDFDAERLGDVLGNLLSNAVKYTPAGGDITLRVLPEHDTWVRIAVQDTGIGIQEEHLDRIFERFYQVDNASNRAGGTGIGLAYARDLVKLMDGAIEVVSEPLVGSVFTVTLPVRRQAPPMEGSPKRARALDAGLPNGGHFSSAESDDLPLLLLVEDNRDVAYYIAESLRSQYRIEWVENGRAGLDKAYDLVPDLVISDIMLPEMDGFELCQSLKTDRRTSHIPVILLTARADEASQLRGLQHGADVYLTKPSRREELLLHVHNLLRLRASIQARYQALGRLAGSIDSPKVMPAVDDDFVRQVIEVIAQHYAETDFGVTEIQRAVGLSSSQLHRKMKALTGNTAGHFLRLYRLEQARHFLKTRPQWTVAEVAYNTGFQDPNYFSRSFSAEFGQTPTEYREAMIERERGRK